MSDTDTQHEEPAELADKLFLSLDDQIKYHRYASISI